MVRTDRNFFILLVGLLGAIGIIDTAILNPTIAAYAKSLGATEFFASFIAGLYAIIAIPASFAMGLSIDAIGRRRALVVGLGLTAVFVFGYALAATPAQLMVFRITHAISGSLVFPASIAMIVDAARRKVSRSLGLYWVVIASVIFIGSAVSGTLVPALGFQPLFVVVAAISLIGMVIALTVPETAARRVMPRASISGIASAIRWLSVAYLSMFSLYFAFGVIVGSLALVIALTGMSLEQAAGTVGLYIALATAVSIPAFPLVARLLERMGTVPTLAGGIGLAAVSQLLLVFSLGLASLILSAVLLGGGIALVFVTSTAVAALPEARGASIGLHQTANIAGVAVGAPISGLLLQTWGTFAPFAVAVLVQVATLVLILASRKVIRPADEKLMIAPDERLMRGVVRERR
ncbi:MAG: MFS transporter [Candidatus Thermoplasmatota archaeon]|nr:MFS transporter [Candidatus Thermoplasmatota archaeon]